MRAAPELRALFDQPAVPHEHNHEFTETT